MSVALADPHPDPLLTTKQVAEYLQLPIATLHQWRYCHEGPRAFKVGRHLRYRQSDVDAWLETTAPPAA